MPHTQIDLPFSDRSEAGRLLGEALEAYIGRTDTLVLALPRGGVPVAFEVAEAIGAPLDLMLVRKLGAPGQEELAMGAIATGGIRVLNPEIVRGLHISDQTIDAVANREEQELRRRDKAYRGDRPPPELRDRCIVLVDDGLATGATMRAAVAALRQNGSSRIVVAVPVAPTDTVTTLRKETDEVVCLAMPEPYYAIGLWYRNFAQVTDQEVRDLLTRAHLRWSHETDGTDLGQSVA